MVSYFQTMHRTLTVTMTVKNKNSALGPKPTKPYRDQKRFVTNTVSRSKPYHYEYRIVNKKGFKDLYRIVTKSDL